MNEFGMSGDDLEQMYQEVILEASKHPHGKESFAPNAAVEQSADAAANVTVQASHEYCTPGESHQFNPTCGDEATIHVEVSDDEPHTIKRLRGRPRLLHFAGQPVGDGRSGGRQNR